MDLPRRRPFRVEKSRVAATLLRGLEAWKLRGLEAWQLRGLEAWQLLRNHDHCRAHVSPFKERLGFAIVLADTAV